MQSPWKGCTQTLREPGGGLDGTSGGAHRLGVEHSDRGGAIPVIAPVVAVRHLLLRLLLRLHCQQSLLLRGGLLLETEAKKEFKQGQCRRLSALLSGQPTCRQSRMRMQHS